VYTEIPDSEVVAAASWSSVEPGTCIIYAAVPHLGWQPVVDLQSLTQAACDCHYLYFHLRTRLLLFSSLSEYKRSNAAFFFCSFKAVAQTLQK